jgi:large repetitive protein
MDSDRIAAGEARVTQWDDLPDAAKNGGVLSALEDALQVGGATGPTTDGDWKVWTKTYLADRLLKLDGFGGLPGGGTPIEFRDPTITIEIGVHQTSGSDDGGWRVVLTSPVVAVHLPFLSPAKYDVPSARLLPDPSVQHVSMVVGGLKLRLMQLSGQSVQFDLLSASTTGNPVDRIYDLVRMEPPYATVGPKATVGIGFRAAVLDLSSEAGPSGLPAGARSMPNAWQGFYLPEVRVFVQPPGLEDLYITAATRDMYIGVGASAGLTAIFEAEVVNATELTVSAHVLSVAGKFIPVVIADPTADPSHGTASVPGDATLFVDTHGGSGSNSVTIAPDNASIIMGTRGDITTDADGTTIQVTVVDAAAGITKHLTVTTTLDTSASGGGGGGVTSLSITPTSALVPFRMVADSLDPAVVRLDPAPPVTATIAWTSSAVPITGDTDEAAVTLDTSALTTTHPLSSALAVTVSGGAAVVSDCFFVFDHPTPAELATPTWARNIENTRDQKSPARDRHAASRSYIDAAKDLATYLDLDTVLTVDGYASYETVQTSYETGNTQYNLDLSHRRLQAALAILRDAGFSKAKEGTPFGAANAHDGAPPRTDTTPAPPIPAPPAKDDGFWWLARAWAPAAPAANVTATLDVTRQEWGGVNTQKDVTPAKQPQPSCFRRIGVRVEILRDTFIRAEVWGEFDLSKAADQSKPGLGLTDQQHDDNPADGIVDFLVRLRISEDRQSWEVDAEFRASAVTASRTS